MGDPLVVADTSPLIKLVGVALLDLLPRLYGRVLVPEQVLAEYQAGASPSDPDLSTISWIQIERATIDPVLLDDLDLGEAAAISLAEAQGARGVLMDDRAGRRIAHERGLLVIGTLAVLLRAKTAGLIPAVRPVMDQMIAQGRYISPRVRAQVLAAADET